MMMGRNSSLSSTTLAATASFVAGAAVALLVSSVLKKSRAAAGDDDDDDENKQRQPDSNQKLISKAESHCWKIVEHSFTGALIYVMDRLDLYETLWLYRPLGASAKQVAESTGYSERWIVELFAQSTAAGICGYDPVTQRFSLKAEYAALLRAPEKEERSLAGMFQFLRGLVSDRPEKTIEATKTGLGVDYDFGESPAVIEGIERKNRNFFLNHFMSDIIEKVIVPNTGKSLVSMLDSGVDCADVGCGCGMSTIVLAKRFPKSRFYAYEASIKSLQILRERVEKERLKNIVLCNVATRTVDKGPRPGSIVDNTFAFVYCHDLLHDMTNPRGLIREVRSRLSRRGGCWVIVDVKCKETLGENLKMPDVALNYGFSSLLCLSSATSCKDAEGLGTMGFHSALARQWMSEAGFEHFEEIDIKQKSDNSCFVVA